MKNDMEFLREPGIIGMDENKKYAVLIPLVATEEGMSLLFEVRAAKLKHQPGEICFPGGSLEGDETSLEAAVRETEEELLVSRESIRVITENDIFLHPGSLTVYSYLAVLENYEGTFSEDEVDEVFTVPLAWLREQMPETYRVPVKTEPGEDFPFELIPGGREYPWRQGYYEVKFYRFGERIIWGMTARMLEAAVKVLGSSKELGLRT